MEYEYPTKRGVLVKNVNGEPVKNRSGYLFRIIGDCNNNKTEYISCDVDISCVEGWTSIKCSDDGYNYILLFDEINKFDNVKDTGNVDTTLPNESNVVDASLDEYDNINETGEETIWNENNTKFLLSLYKEYIELVRNRKLKTKAKMWEKIALDFHNKGFTFNSKQIENRFKTLERRYKSSNETNKSTGRGRNVFQYKRDLDDIFEKDPKIFPEILLTGTTTIHKEELRKKYNISSETELCQTDIDSVDESASTSYHSIPSRKGQKRSVDVLIDIKNELKESAKLKSLEKEEKINLIKDRNKELKRKNDLFEKYLALKFPHSKEN